MIALPHCCSVEDMLWSVAEQIKVVVVVNGGFHSVFSTGALTLRCGVTGAICSHYRNIQVFEYSFSSCGRMWRGEYAWMKHSYDQVVKISSVGLQLWIYSYCLFFILCRKKSSTPTQSQLSSQNPAPNKSTEETTPDLTTKKGSKSKSNKKLTKTSATCKSSAYLLTMFISTLLCDCWTVVHEGQTSEFII